MKRIWVGFLFVLIAALGSLGCKSSSVTGTSPATGANRVAIAVTDHGFDPSRVQVQSGQPVTMVVTRQTMMACGSEMVIPAYDIHQLLPMNQPLEITFMPDMPGQIDFQCGMGMMTGTIMAR